MGNQHLVCLYGHITGRYVYVQTVSGSDIEVANKLYSQREIIKNRNSFVLTIGHTIFQIPTNSREISADSESIFDKIRDI
ncbi:hypothetical protein [Metabacillus niabensis]|uniref:hypothetical protein n=1 Tax=Metabacillus niabensis TaxID=324854 RepID=UPI001CFB861E|nr:hypothetical protein [Metabacillus niabensis]